MAKVLILDDTPELVATLTGMLEDEGHTVEAEMNPDLAMERIKSFTPDLVTLDISFSEHQDETGIALLQALRKEYTKAQMPVLVISGTGNADKITRMLAWDINGFLSKPAKRAALVKKVNDALETKFTGQGAAGSWDVQMIGKSPALLELVVEISKAAKAESDLMIAGESGAGKEQVVQKYRELSPRRHKPFVVVDCTNIQHTTFESEIFGHEKGAFTGAHERKKGKIEAANGGIVFFDEIGDLPENQQPKLLRLLQEKTFTRMGSHMEIKLDAVILAATSRDLHQLMQEGALSKALYYRLDYTKIEMPPLREHLEDIPELVAHFILKANWKYRKNVLAAETEVLGRFQNLRWDGNVRQLEKCVEQGVLKCEGRRLKWQDVAGFLRNETMSAPLSENNHGIDLNINYETFKRFMETERHHLERRYYLHHLEQCCYNVQKTADQIGMARAQLNEIMKRLGIKKPVKEKT